MDLADRFEQKVDRLGDHHLWVGSKKAKPSGGCMFDKLRINDPHKAGCIVHLRRVTQPLRRP